MHKKISDYKVLDHSGIVQEAADAARQMVHRETRGTGDTRGAIERLSRRHGIPFHILWQLRYAPPHDIMVRVYAAIINAHRRELARQLEILKHEIATSKPRTGIGQYIFEKIIAESAEGPASVSGTDAANLVPEEPS